MSSETSCLAPIFLSAARLFIFPLLPRTVPSARAVPVLRYRLPPPAPHLRRAPAATRPARRWGGGSDTHTRALTASRGTSAPSPRRGEPTPTQGALSSFREWPLSPPGRRGAISLSLLMMEAGGEGG